MLLGPAPGVGAKRPGEEHDPVTFRNLQNRGVGWKAGPGPENPGSCRGFAAQSALHARACYGLVSRCRLSPRQAIGRATASLGALALLLLAAPPARANGAFPSVSQLVADPADADHLVLRATFGLLVTRDRGATWDWLCEAGMGYRDLEPPMAVLPGGVILLGVPGGVSRSDEAGCSFVPAEGIDATVYDLARVPAHSEQAVAISAMGTDAQLWRTMDAGKSFAPVGDVIAGFIPATVDVAATDPDVIYASGLSGTMGALLRSEDGGLTFERFPVPSTTTARRPFIAAVDPRDADTVYVRLDAQGSSPLEVTHDGGKTFDAPLVTTVSASGFAISPDGKTVIASNGYDGTFRAPTDTMVFEKVACSGPTCLSFSEAGLFGCGDQIADGFVVGRSDDLGATFERVVDLTCLRGPAACGEETSIGSLCPAAWPDVQKQLNAAECSPPDVQPYTGCFGSAGSNEGGGGGAPPSTGGAGAGGSAGGTAASAGRPSRPGAPSPGGGGCSCHAVSGSHRGSLPSLALVVGLIASRRRRGSARRR
jgi:photosystem II stability/assembly factor-like uncharacterized protein